MRIRQSTGSNLPPQVSSVVVVREVAVLDVVLVLDEEVVDVLDVVLVEVLVDEHVPHKTGQFFKCTN
jgi:hypothetical protein